MCIKGTQVWEGKADNIEYENIVFKLGNTKSLTWTVF